MEAAVIDATYTRRPGDFAARWLGSTVLKFDLVRHATIGMVFWVLAQMQPEAFAVQTFGQFALQFPAEFWAVAMMAGSTITYTGVMHPPQKWAVIVGSFINVSQFSGLAYSALITGGEKVVGLYALGFAVAAGITLLSGLLHDAR